MHIQKASIDDLDRVLSLVSEVSTIDILPLFSEQGKKQFIERVIPDLHTVFGGENFLAIKAIYDGKLLGFAALRDGNYVTHLFVSKQAQGSGLGRDMLNHLLASTESNEVSLRSSINATGFYRHNGFTVSGDEGEVNGIRFVPMSLIRT
ncbi:GNAT family N-acetyltransferase [Vibrio europaeus]|uniref:Acetyltransferase n=1 Tax=Vibrio europaeus TaxID=300876 RepID=A0A178J9I5_9VIBR|nr:GNAT family N-acetyltransferase [Vibrio europaeus]MDC5704768.1 GNAT family N-acetyltransferase [Vibrio europaeus]MDC5710047.1 GNAT family N-acetyltransferase [Vibrio europaeus]MDC5715137.1 GNAT family N-acetyltransferase [Vibrio europaeus]MDC5724814.1 GNAT family N-acetyltransferase [Vibrio europaeus]MDC5728489.1 GNAT family N-acetyltransferase [Vibrio europaeus]